MYLFSLNIKLLPMKICWLFIEKSLRYLCWTHIIRLGEPCKEKKKRKIQFDFSFFSFFRCVWTKQRFHLICCWKRLNLCSFFTLVLLPLCPWGGWCILGWIFSFWPSSSTYPTQSSPVQYWKNEHCQDDFWNEGPFLSEVETSFIFGQSV